MFGHSCHSPSLKFYSKLDVGNVIIVILSRSMKCFLMSISWRKLDHVKPARELSSCPCFIFTIPTMIFYHAATFQ